MAILGKIFTWITPYLGKIVLYAGISAVAYFLYQQHVNKIEDAALANYNKTQLEQVVTDQQKTNEQLRMIAEQQAIILGDLQKRNLEIQQQYNDIDQFLRSEVARRSDRPSSDVLKQTIELLRKQQK